MSYHVFFANLTEENRSLMLTLLRLKAEAGKIAPEEDALLSRLREQGAGRGRTDQPRSRRGPQQARSAFSDGYSTDNGRATEPATEAPATEAPATEAPATEE